MYLLWDVRSYSPFLRVFSLVDGGLWGRSDFVSLRHLLSGKTTKKKIKRCLHPSFGVQVVFDQMKIGFVRPAYRINGLFTKYVRFHGSLR